MIKHSEVLAACHCVADVLQDKGDKQDYYCLNHISSDDWNRLARVVAVWLNLQKIEIDYEK